MIDANEYAKRRNEFFDLLDDNSVTILFAGVGKKKSGDENYDFVPNKNFYYLTGIRQENSILMLVKNDGEKMEYLFVDEKDEKIEKWTGYKLNHQEAKDISGISNVFVRTAFEGKILAFFNDNERNSEPITKFYLDLENELKIGEMKSTQAYKKELEVVHGLEVLDCHELIMGMRMIKSEAEIEMIREAIASTELGLKNALINLAPGKYEYNMRNIFNYTIYEDQDSDLAFPSIVAGGKNGVILHYPNQKDQLKDGDLVLFDVGAAKNYYCGDISRTYPVNGKFTDIQKVIYEIVLNCNKQTAAFMRPGITLKEANEFAKMFLANECFEKGLITSKEDIGKVNYHSVSHHLGLDTHDGTDRISKLIPGNVVTCEPGLYFKDLGIGVRIEDDILITEDGSEVLSKDIIKEVKDIEKMLGSKK
ncbi:MAG: aminopeptidase P N-terminal domain-containing protein [Firmicutes bacterium]|nr:aminopeptidase P N-terminal domain-containing protein [Candidatus Fiminaster equi]